MLRLDPYIVRVLLPDLVGHDRRPAAFLVYLWLHAEQSRIAAPVTISYHGLAEAVGISRSSAQSAVALLLRRRLLTATKPRPTSTPTYTVLQPWLR
ncbi:MAG: helix-turn-helix domain-containing protein [Terriglobales bacterium]